MIVSIENRNASVMKSFYFLDICFEKAENNFNRKINKSCLFNYTFYFINLDIRENNKKYIQLQFEKKKKQFYHA